MLLLDQFLFSLAIAVPILAQISALQLPSMDRMDPRYLKFFIYSSCWFIMMFPLLASVVLIITLLFSELISIPFDPALPASLPVSSCSSLLLPANRLMSSANLRLLSSLFGGYLVFLALFFLGRY